MRSLRPLAPWVLVGLAGLAAFVVLLRLRGRADLFTVYLVGYAVFRFLVEFVRGNEIVFAGMTRPQLFLLALAPLAVGRYVLRNRRRHDDREPGLDPAPAAGSGR